jgi:hypothetical protein
VQPTGQLFHVSRAVGGRTTLVGELGPPEGVFPATVPLCGDREVVERTCRACRRVGVDAPDHGDGLGRQLLGEVAGDAVVEHASGAAAEAHLVLVGRAGLGGTRGTDELGAGLALHGQAGEGLPAAGDLAGGGGRPAVVAGEDGDPGESFRVDRQGRAPEVLGQPVGDATACPTVADHRDRTRGHVHGGRGRRLQANPRPATCEHQYGKHYSPHARSLRRGSVHETHPGRWGALEDV